MHKCCLDINHRGMEQALAKKQQTLPQSQPPGASLHSFGCIRRVRPRRRSSSRNMIVTAPERASTTEHGNDLITYKLPFVISLLHRIVNLCNRHIDSSHICKAGTSVCTVLWSLMLWAWQIRLVQCSVDVCINYEALGEEPRQVESGEHTRAHGHFTHMLLRQFQAKSTA